jgi:SAM-dependent methyltransferase
MRHFPSSPSERAFPDGARLDAHRRIAYVVETMEVPATYLAKVRRGERPTPNEALAFLRAWHAVPREEAKTRVRSGRLADGRTSDELLASCVPEGADVTVVDLACGDGLLSTALLGRLGPGARVIGIDASAVDVALARAREPSPRATFACELASVTSLPAASAAAVLCHYALMLFVPLRPVVAEIARILAPGGVFASVVPATRSVRAVSPELQAEVDALRRADLPSFPDLGLTDPELLTPGPQGLFTRAAGFDEPISITSHTAVSRWDRATFIASFQDTYWFDLLRDDTRARLLQATARIVEPLPEPLEMDTELQLVVASRRR